MSEFTEKKARNLIDAKYIMYVGDDTYQVKASTPGKSYIISDGVCECVGFKFRGDCSHVVAVQMLQKQSSPHMTNPKNIGDTSYQYDW